MTDAEDRIRALLTRAFDALARGDEPTSAALYDEALDIDIELTEKLRPDVAREKGWLGP